MTWESPRFAHLWIERIGQLPFCHWHLISLLKMRTKVRCSLLQLYLYLNFGCLWLNSQMSARNSLHNESLKKRKKKKEKGKSIPPPPPSLLIQSLPSDTPSARRPLRLLDITPSPAARPVLPSPVSFQALRNIFPIPNLPKLEQNRVLPCGCLEVGFSN